MNKFFVIVDVRTGEYFYGFYTGQNWCKDFDVAQCYGTRQQAKEALGYDEFKSRAVEIKKVYVIAN